MSKEELRKMERLALVARAFSPAAPVNSVELFAYRDAQVRKCVGTAFQRGRHIALYGERGVGKTSLANVLPMIMDGTVSGLDMRGVRIDCNSQDDFPALWRKIFEELGLSVDGDHPKHRDPEDIRRSLQSLHGTTLIVLDELDRFDDDEGLSLLADTIKTLSDHSVDATIMIVGVADSLVALLGEHESVVRSLVQIQMPRMSDAELRDTLKRGLATAQMSMEDEAKDKIVRISEGLPHFTHLLGQASCERSVFDDRTNVSLSDIHAAMEEAVFDAHSYKAEYDLATASPQPTHLYEEVLLACAYASRDELGFFRAADVRGPLAIILGREVPMSGFQRHLSEFSGDSRGHVLHRSGEERRFRFRFKNPLLQPYAKIRAVSTGLIAPDQERGLEALRDPTGRLRGTIEPEQLF